MKCSADVNDTGGELTPPVSLTSAADIDLLDSITIVVVEGGGGGGGFLVICVSERPRDPIGIHSCHPHLSLHPPFHEYCALLKIQKSENKCFVLEIAQFGLLFITRKLSNMYILHILSSYFF